MYDNIRPHLISVATQNGHLSHGDVYMALGVKWCPHFHAVHTGFTL